MPTGNPNGNESDNSDGGNESSFVTQDQLSQMVNQAVSGHVKRLETRLATSLGDVIAKQLKEHAPKQTSDDDDPNADDPPIKGDKSDPALLAMERRMTKLNSRLKASEDARAAEASQRRNDGLKSALLKQLGESGLSGQHLRGAQAVLYQDGRVVVNEDGSHIFRGADGDDLPLAEGVKDWIASDDAKLFLPPKDPRGSGDQGHRGPIPKVKNEGMSQALADAIEGVRKHRLNE